MITGAASGIGAATARLFWEEGARVLLLDREVIACGVELAADIALTLQVDITNHEAVVRAIEEGARFLGGIDGVVNSAGIMRTGPTETITPDIWRSVIDVNLSGTYFVTSACLPWLRGAGAATIVNVASGAGLLPNSPGLAAYAASKGGVIALTKALAADLAPAIRVNCVSPGIVDTPMADAYRSNVGNYALRRLGDPHEIAQALLFLTGPESNYITGATLAVDGGRTFH